MRTGRAAQVMAAVVACTLAVAVVGCGNKPEDAGTGPRPIRLAGVFCLCHIGPYVAWKKGFFQKEGVPVKDYVFTKGGADTFQALARGDVDFGVSGLDAVIRGRETGLKVRAVADVYPEFYALSVRRDLAGDIRSGADLKGRSVGISKIGSASWAFLQLIMRQSGLKEGDVKILQLGSIDTIVAGLRARKVDAAITWEPGTSQLRADGAASDLLDMLRPADHRQLLGSATSLSMTLAARDDLIEKNPELVRRTVRALDEGYAWIKSHSAQEVADAVAPLAQGVDRKVLVDGIRASIAVQPRSTAISKSAFQASATLLQSAGVIKKVPPLEEPFSCQFTKCSK
jgi:NitT/TauT family transport system substrate-binding protein